ncbi:MAG: peptidylprolyl isomerase [Alphaproteobacteria bacterium]
MAKQGNGQTGFQGRQTVAIAGLVVLTAFAAPQLRAQEAERLSPAQIIAQAPEDHWRMLDPEHTLYIDMEAGRVVVELTQDLAPAHVAQVKALTRAGYYDGLDFYRVIDGFVAQGGDINAADPDQARPLPPTAQPTMTAEFDEALQPGLSYMPIPGPDGYADRTGFLNGFPAGIDPRDGRIWLAHCYGAFAFGREEGADTASTEFYITLGVQRYLDRNLTVFGKVRQGMELLQALPRGDEGPGMISDPKKRAAFTFRVAADVPVDQRTPLEVMDTNSLSFRALIRARRNRPEPFFKYRPDHADVCAIPIPVRPVPDQFDTSED